MVVPGGKDGNYWLVGMEFQFEKMKKVLETDCGDGFTIIQMYLVPQNYTLKMVKMETFMLYMFYQISMKETAMRYQFVSTDQEKQKKHPKLLTVSSI